MELNTIRNTAARARAEGLPLVTETALRGWIKAGLLPVIPVGNRQLICWEALLEFLRAGVISPGGGLPRPIRNGRRSR